ncbi:YaiI/YqxD family protein [Lachnoclostridium sp.]|uniref:YaiI/YqxD family protein n=1 Tax=Lachnoclostridium sp. TaxID=2028282 RepID=UPI0028A2AF6E|nr:YaiI/YqxD family protein [Lachnoclostridium sp.]
MKIVVDADACPVKGIIEQVAKEHQIEVIMFIDTSHVLYSDYSKIITVSKAPDAVDFALLNQTNPDDIVVTQDYGVAAMALGKKAKALHPSGKIYTNENINQMLFERHIAKEQRRHGKQNLRCKNNKKRTAQDDIRFEFSLNELLKSISS